MSDFAVAGLILLALAAVMGAVFGPLSYMAGQRIGGLEFIDTRASIIALAVIWGIAMPLLVIAAKRFDGVKKFQPTLPLPGLSRG